ncbi:MAG: peptidase S41, partial [Chloroflexia bacterium]|nr:peptidase S41 [Chloroflexia bacterium]
MDCIMKQGRLGEMLWLVLGLIIILGGCSGAAPPLAPSIEGLAATATVIPAREPDAPTIVLRSPTDAPLPSRPPEQSVAVVGTAVAELAPTALSLVTRREIFTEVWRLIQEYYLYDDFGGVDWYMVRDEFEPIILAAPTDAAFYEAITRMVARLGDNHSRFVPPQAARREDAITSGREEQVGIGVIVLPLSDGLMIQHIFPDSPALQSGLRPRDRIVAIDGAFFSHGDLEGPDGSQVRLAVVRPGEESRDILITRRLVEGAITPTARILPGDIAYLGITTLWVSNMDQQVTALLTEMVAAHDLRGVILDLRSNPGGWRTVLAGILSNFVSGEVGSFTNRQGDVPLVIEPGSLDILRGMPLIVLVDRSTASYAELMAAILQSQAGAVIVGVPTSGNTETIY